MIDAILSEGQVWQVGRNRVTAIRAFPNKTSGNCGCVRWLEVVSGDEVIARVNPEYTAYVLYRKD